jgi:N-acetyl-anhydromuramyl-L-alanine amidase AmpD
MAKPGESSWTNRSRPDRSAIGIEIANFGLMYKEGAEFYLERGNLEKRYKKEQYGEPKRGTLYLPGVIPIEGYWEPYTPMAIDAVVRLVVQLKKVFDIPLERIVGHEDVASPVGRKVDPGPLWPWVEFMLRVRDLGGVSVPPNVWSLHRGKR